MKTFKTVTLILIFLLLALAIGYVLISKSKTQPSTKVTSEKQKQVLQYPYFPANTETFLDTEKTWQRASFQPIFKDFVDASSSGRFLTVQYATHSSEALLDGKIYVGRNIPYIDEQNKRSVIDSVQFKEILKPGDRFGVEYLSLVPKDFSLRMPHCQNNPIECQLATNKQEGDKIDEKVFYAIFVYRILKK